MKITMEQIAKEASVSRSTVSKALNNCVNVDRETKSRILAIAKAYGYATRHMEETGYAIAAVLPVNPSYFWREAMVGLREALMDAPDCTCIYALYSALNQEKEFLQCLEDAVRKSTTVLIAAAPSSDLVRQRLEDIARERCVILLNEGPAAENTYYVGMNAYEDGWGLAHRCASLLKTHSRILMVRCAEANHRTERRNAGFWDGVRTFAPQSHLVRQISNRRRWQLS